MIRCSAVHKETVKQKARIEREFSLVSQVSMLPLGILISVCLWWQIRFPHVLIEKGSAFAHLYLYNNIVATLFCPSISILNYNLRNHYKGTPI